MHPKAYAGSDKSAKPQRDAKGRFLLGNDGGAGNPFHRHLARARIKWSSLAQPEDVERVYKAVLEKACDGCVSAQKIYLQYLLGKPTEMVNPDRVDIDEWEFYAKTNEMQKKSPDVTTNPDHQFALEIARTIRPVMAEEARKEMLVGLKEMEENDREMERVEDEYEERQKREAAREDHSVDRMTPAERSADAKREGRSSPETQSSFHGSAARDAGPSRWPAASHGRAVQPCVPRQSRGTRVEESARLQARAAAPLEPGFFAGEQRGIETGAPLEPGFFPGEHPAIETEAPLEPGFSPAQTPSRNGFFDDRKPEIE